jgi:hypothetical protein
MLSSEPVAPHAALACPAPPRHSIPRSTTGLLPPGEHSPPTPDPPRPRRCSRGCHRAHGRRGGAHLHLLLRSPSPDRVRPHRTVATRQSRRSPDRRRSPRDPGLSRADRLAPTPPRPRAAAEDAARHQGSPLHLHRHPPRRTDQLHPRYRLLHPPLRRYRRSAPARLPLHRPGHHAPPSPHEQRALANARPVPSRCAPT